MEKQADSSWLFYEQEEAFQLIRVVRIETKSLSCDVELISFHFFFGSSIEKSRRKVDQSRTTFASPLPNGTNLGQERSPSVEKSHELLFFSGAALRFYLTYKNRSLPSFSFPYVSWCSFPYTFISLPAASFALFGALVHPSPYRLSYRLHFYDYDYFSIYIFFCWLVSCLFCLGGSKEEEEKEGDLCQCRAVGPSEFLARIDSSFSI